jgi:hypothetical protein
LADTTTTTTTTTLVYDEDPPFVALTPHWKLSHSPRFTPVSNPGGNHSSSSSSSKLVFLTSINGFDTHAGCMTLGVLDCSNSNLDTYSEDITTTSSSSRSEDKNETLQKNPVIIVQEVWDPMTTTTQSGGIVAGLNFPGLFLPQLPNSCFISSEYLVTTTQWGSCQKVVRISVTTGSVHLIQLDGCHPLSSDEVLCCSVHQHNNDWNGVVVSTKTPGIPATVHFIYTDQLVQEINPSHAIHVSSIVLSTYAPIAASKIASTQMHPRPYYDIDFDIRVIDAPKVDGVDCNHDIQSILMLPSHTTAAFNHA